MTTLAADKLRPFYDADIEGYPVIAADIIYKGAAVGENASGYARPLQAGDKFLGFALEQVDNSGGAAGDAYVKTRIRGRIQLPVGSLAITDNDGVEVYASDDDTFVKTAASNSYIGKVTKFISAGVGIVDYDATRSALNGIAALTDNSTGTANDTVEVVGATNGGDVSGAINNNFADLAAKVNAIIAALS